MTMKQALAWGYHAVIVPDFCRTKTIDGVAYPDGHAVYIEDDTGFRCSKVYTSETSVEYAEFGDAWNAAWNDALSEDTPRPGVIP